MPQTIIIELHHHGVPATAEFPVAVNDPDNIPFAAIRVANTPSVVLPGFLSNKEIDQRGYSLLKIDRDLIIREFAIKEFKLP